MSKAARKAIEEARRHLAFSKSELEGGSRLYALWRVWRAFEELTEAEDILAEEGDGNE